jgi:hypothetical protein
MVRDIAEFKRQIRAQKMVDELGRLRGGNSGIYYPGEACAACHCPRKTILRSFFGVEEVIPESKQLVFSAGLDSESQIVQDLTAWAQRNGYSMLAQNEIGTRWLTDKGVPVTGSPDFVLVDREARKPVMGIELKQMLSAYKVKDTLSEYAGADALIQAAHYSMQLGKIPWFLRYTSAVQHHNVNHIFGMQTVYGQKRYEHLFDWATSRAGSKDGKLKAGDKYPKSITGFSIMFELVWREVDAGCPNADWQVGLKFGGISPDGGFKENMPREDVLWTAVTWNGIKGFYELCSDPSGETWPSAPIMIDIAGNEKSFKLCSYCGFEQHCKKMEKVNKPSVAKLAEMIKREGG